jgi:hypothetical protein
LSTAATAYPPQPSKLPAPLWHTGILLLYVLVPYTWWPGWTRLLRALPYNSASFDILSTAIYTAVVAFICLGLSLRQTPLEQMIGELWTSWKSALRDIAIGLGLWLVARYADRLIYYLAGAYPSRARLYAHTKGELLISIFNHRSRLRRRAHLPRLPAKTIHGALPEPGRGIVDSGFAIHLVPWLPPGTRRLLPAFSIWSHDRTAGTLAQKPIAGHDRPCLV